MLVPALSAPTGGPPPTSYAPIGTVPGTEWTPPRPPSPAQSHVPRPYAFFSAGAAPARFQLLKSVFLTGQYTDNFLLVPEDQEKESDFRTTIGLGLTLLINTGKTQGTIATSLSVAHDTAQTGGVNAGFFPTFYLSLFHEFDPRFTMTVSDTFVRNDSAFQLDSLGLRRQTSIGTSNLFTVSANWLIDRFVTQYYYQLSTFFSQPTDFNTTGNNNSTTISNVLGINGSTPLGLDNTFQLGYEFSSRDNSGFANTNQPSDEGQLIGNLIYASFGRQLGRYASGGLSGSYQAFSLNDASTWNLSLFGTYGIPAGLSLSASVGYSQLRSDLGSPGGSIVGSGSIVYRLPRGVVSAGYNSGYLQTYLTGEDFGLTLTRSYYASMSYTITPFVTATVGATYTQNDLTGIGNVKDNTPLDYLNGQATLSWQVLRWLNATLSYNYYRYTGGTVQTTPQVQEDSGPPISANLVSFTLTAAF